MFRSVVFFVLLLQVIHSLGSRTCFNHCIISRLRRVPLVVPGDRCATKVGSYCEASVRFQRSIGEYTVKFSTHTKASYERFIHALPSDYLNFAAANWCASNDS